MTKWLCALLVCLAACDADQPAQHRTADAWSLSEVCIIGSVNDVDAALTRPILLATRSGGGIYVGQPSDGVIKVFGDDCEHEATIGRTGLGPGEFRRLHQIGTRGDTLYATDSQVGRLTLFSPSGEYWSDFTTPLPPLNETTPVLLEALLADGTLLASAQARPNDYFAGTIQSEPVMRYSRDGSFLDTLVDVPLKHRFMGVQHPDRWWAGVYGSQSFPDHVLWRISPNGDELTVVTRESPSTREDASFQITRIDLHGDTLWTRSPSYDPEPLPTERTDSVLAHWIELVLASRGPEISSPTEAERRIRQNLNLPQFQPGVTGAFVSESGQAWIHVRQASPPESAYWVFDETGNLIAQAQYEGFEVRVANGDHVWGIRYDELDVPYVVMARIDR